MSAMLHRCGAPQAAPADSRGASRCRSTGPVIDIHCHVHCPQVEDLVQGLPGKLLEVERAGQSLGAASVAHNQSLMSQWLPRLVDSDVRLADMDAMGIDRQVLSPSPTQYYYWAERDLSAQLVELQNEAIAGLCARHPDRYSGLAAVSLQHPELAVDQLRKAFGEYGFRGVEISSCLPGMELSDPRLAPFWQCAEDLGAIVFLHPLASILGDRGKDHYLANLVGVPLETTLALSHLIFGGVLDRHSGLKLVAAHGGGFFGSYWARFDHGWNVRPECHTCAHPPSSYLRRIYMDNVMFDPQQLAALVEQHGADRILLGTDYPFDMGLSDPVGLVESLRGLTDKERDAILGRNAAGLLGLNDLQPAS